MKSIVLSLTLVFSGISIFGAASDTGGPTDKIIEAIEKVRKAPIVGTPSGLLVYNTYFEKELDLTKALLEEGKRAEAIQKLRDVINRGEGMNDKYHGGRTIFASETPATVLWEIYKGRPENITEGMGNEESAWAYKEGGRLDERNRYYTRPASGITSSAAESDGAGPTKNIIEAIKKVLKAPIVSASGGSTSWNSRFEKELKYIKWLLKEERRAEAIRDLEKLMKMSRGIKDELYGGRTIFESEVPATVFREIYMGRPENITEGMRNKEAANFYRKLYLLDELNRYYTD